LLGPQFIEVLVSLGPFLVQFSYKESSTSVVARSVGNAVTNSDTSVLTKWEGAHYSPAEVAVPAQLNASNKPAFVELCLLLRNAPGQRSLADCLRIGQLIDSFFPSDGPGETTRKDVYRQRFAVNLVDQLRENRIDFTTSTAYWYRRFATFPDKAFLKACREAKHARWEDVMRLLSVKKRSLRLKLLAIADAEGRKRKKIRLSARAFKELVLLEVRRDAIAGNQIRKATKPATLVDVKRLHTTAKSAEAEVTMWLAGDVPLADRLRNVRGLDTKAAGKALAALRLFRAAACRLMVVLHPVISPTARQSSAKTKRQGQPS
jgi:hypothetical protein